ncbi:hypothetical protein VB319_19720 [Vibrio parahaemolyticus]|uniref:hypothetical protein n=1 Tax=Vibrio TaxID=662 RepID=UPI002963EEE3|nr:MULTISPECIES: hypothetical protein [Vibrio]EGR5855884.1 hypothetical protein [Vibrio parahaemolyticus]MBE4779821.1 hypothetical protein [Vibrio parahaemolyticus]MDG3410280.1 hypothetical protein [Vibrio parahaemolyticus]MDW1965336.1 hypothetical protein [Vibrio sp. Vb0587]MEA5356202.1 hypothetical protein [Vibrio parahaemolyticus]
MNKIELAKKLLEYAVYDNHFVNPNYHKSSSFFEALENRANETMVYAKVFWRENRFTYAWGKGFLTQNDREKYQEFVEELASHIEFLGVDKGKLTIDSSAGFEKSALGSPYTYSEPMNFTFVLSAEKACELFAVLEQHYSNMVHSISLIELFNPVHEQDIDSIVESKREQARAEIINKLSKIKRGYLAHLPSVFGFSVNQLRGNTYDLVRNDVTERLYDKVEQLNRSIQQSLIDAGVLVFAADNREHVRFMNKADFKKTFKAAERKALYAELPELKDHFEPVNAAKAA